MQLERMVLASRKAPLPLGKEWWKSRNLKIQRNLEVEVDRHRDGLRWRKK